MMGFAILFLLTIQPFFKSEAFSQPNAVPCGPVELTSSASFLFTSYDTYLFWNNVIYVKSVAESPSSIYFTNASLGSPNYPGLSFGLGVQYANATLDSINSSSVGIITSSVESGQTNSFVYFNFTTVQGPPSFIKLVSSSGNTTVSNSSEFYKNYSQFEQSSGQTFYLASDYVELKTQSASSIVFSFYTPSTSSSSKSHTVLTCLSPSVKHPQPGLTQLLLLIAIISSIAAGGGFGGFIFLRRRRRAKKNATDCLTVL